MEAQILTKVQDFANGLSLHFLEEDFYLRLVRENPDFPNEPDVHWLDFDHERSFCKSVVEVAQWTLYQASGAAVLFLTKKKVREDKRNNK